MPALPPLMDVAAAIPDAVIDLRYATANNFLGRPVYPLAAAFLRLPTLDKLAKAADALRAKGLRLVLYDAYRPLAAQRQFWAAKPDSVFVADPKKGSNHNRAAAVDVGLAGQDGKALPMPSEFDDFTEKATQSYSEGDPSARERRETLRAAMEAAGFRSIEAEWWHYSDPDGAAWPLLDFDLDLLARRD
jgi:zinc D-Ala-D-Ala dipeptidase